MGTPACGLPGPCLRHEQLSNCFSAPRVCRHPWAGCPVCWHLLRGQPTLLCLVLICVSLPSVAPCGSLVRDSPSDSLGTWSRLSVLLEFFCIPVKVSQNERGITANRMPAAVGVKMSLKREVLVGGWHGLRSACYSSVGPQGQFAASTPGSSQMPSTPGSNTLSWTLQAPGHKWHTHTGHMQTDTEIEICRPCS